MGKENIHPAVEVQAGEENKSFFFLDTFWSSASGSTPER